MQLVNGELAASNQLLNLTATKMRAHNIKLVRLIHLAVPAAAFSPATAALAGRLRRPAGCESRSRS